MRQRCTNALVVSLASTVACNAQCPLPFMRGDVDQAAVANLMKLYAEYLWTAPGFTFLRGMYLFVTTVGKALLIAGHLVTDVCVGFSRCRES